MATQDTPPLPPSVSESTSSGLFFYPLEGELIRTAVLGAIIGLLLPLLSNAFDSWFIRPVFCHTSQIFAFCASSGALSYVVLTVLLATGALIMLAHWQIFRPALIVIAATAAMWGFRQHMSAVEAHGALEYYTLSTLLYSAVYLLFYWLMRLRSIVAGGVAALMVIVLIRILLY
jgi:hypothetical protein